jgi:hypothetical protein
VFVQRQFRLPPRDTRGRSGLIARLAALGRRRASRFAIAEGVVVLSQAG